MTTKLKDPEGQLNLIGKIISFCNCTLKIFSENKYYFAVCFINFLVLASNRLHKIRPILDETRKTFRGQMNPPKHQSIDEGMVKYKGRYFARQYMPNKPVKRGLKVCNNIGIRIKQHFHTPTCPNCSV